MRIGIIGAMDVELATVISCLTNQSSKVYSPEYVGKVEFRRFEYRDLDVVLCASGCGKVNAALATSILISKFKCTDIINVGICGTLSKHLKPGDLVIPDLAMQYDCDTTELGETRYMIQGTSGITKYSISKKLRDCLAVAANICGRDTYMSDCLAASGDTFIGSKKQIKYYGLNKLKPAVVDMESGAIAHTCWILGAEFAAIKEVTDDCSSDDYESNKHTASSKLSSVILVFLSKLSETKVTNNE